MVYLKFKLNKASCIFCGMCAFMHVMSICMHVLCETVYVPVSVYVYVESI